MGRWLLYICDVAGSDQTWRRHFQTHLAVGTDDGKARKAFSGVNHPFAIETLVFDHRLASFEMWELRRTLNLPI
jgi:hypothetical protein